MPRNSILTIASVVTTVQAWFQFILSSLALLQYYCVIDVLRHFPIFMYIRILYFQNPNCGTNINIGDVIDSMPNQAFVMVNREPMTTTRTLIVNFIYFGLSILWGTCSFFLLRGARRGSHSVHILWPWLIMMLIMFALDLCVSIVYVTDTFSTQTLAELVEFAGGVLSGAGASANISTTIASWSMVAVYSRFVFIIFINLFLVICVLCDCGRLNSTLEPDSEIGDKTFSETASNDEGSNRPRIPRVNIMRRMPAWLSHYMTLRDNPRRTSTPNYQPPSSVNRTLTSNIEPDKKLGVNFPENLLSLPQRLENIIAEQQRRLESAVIDTAGRSSPNQPTQSLPHVLDVVSELDRGHGEDNKEATSNHLDSKGRRNTAAELQGQLPWSYIPPSAHRMRDQLPEDEELPPVPVPDYTLHPKYRKASVHRAGSNASMLHRTENQSNQSTRGTGVQVMEADVLY